MQTSLPRDVCPLCHEQALVWNEPSCVCSSCGALFEVHLPSNTLFYTIVPAEYESLASQLTSRWLSPDELETIISSAAAAGRTAPIIMPGNSASARLPRGLMWIALLLGIICILLCASVGGLTLFTDARQTRNAIALQGSPTINATDTPGLSPVASATTPITLNFPTQAPPTVPPAIPAPSPVATTAQQQGVSVVPLLVQTANAAETATAVANRPIQANATQTSIRASPTSAPLDTATTAPVSVPPTFTRVPPSNTPLPATPTIELSPTSTATAQPTSAQTTTPTPTSIGSGTATATNTPTATVTSTATPSRSLVITHIKFQADTDNAETSEYIEIKNMGTTPIVLSGWSVWSRSRNKTYNLPPNLIMYSTDTCRFYSGGSAAGTAPSNSTCPKQDLVNVPIGGDIWGPGDIAQLRDPSGAIISSCTFNPLADVTIHDATCN